MQIKTRFAPSPTGYLHIGGARTALFSWLYAKKHQGKFVLRIEDTDEQRSTKEAVEVILEGMRWLGLHEDEGPFFQSQRKARYQQLIQQLLEEDKAYYCYCSKEELQQMREEQMRGKQKPRYNGRCRHLHNTPPAGREDIKPVIRFKTPLTGEVVFQDLVKGTVRVANQELDDLIIARADGTPTYNFVVVVDDMDMGLTHIIRGDDHLNNTPRQIHILRALDAPIPQYAHLPMILDDKGAKLSKRHGAANLLNYREQGYLPQALLNYLVRLGWSHGDQEVFSRAEMITLFDLTEVNTSASAINPDKLLWLNHHYIMHLNPEDIQPHLQWQMQKLGIDVSAGPPLTAVITALAERCKTLLEMAQASRYFYQDFEQFEEKAAKKNLKPAALPTLQFLRDAFAGMDTRDWQAEQLHAQVQAAVKSLDLKFGKVAQPLRVAITGAGASPSIDITLALIGQQRVLQRLDKAIAYIEDRG